jgi:two-component system response regulator ArlR
MNLTSTYIYPKKGFVSLRFISDIIFSEVIMAKILIIEDDERIARFLQLELEHEGYETITIHRGRQGLDEALRDDIDLVLLDVMLPELSGMEILRRLRQSSDVPVIILSAKGDVVDKVSGLDLGADDYLAKPYSIEELFARIRRLLRTPHLPSVYTAGQLTLDPLSYKVTYGDELIKLTKTEFSLLLYFFENRGRVLTREQVIEEVWGYDYMGDTNVLDVYVRYLRAKIDQAYGVKLIHTHRGVGYRFDER